MSPVLAPRRVSVALVVTVVPCTITSMHAEKVGKRERLIERAGELAQSGEHADRRIRRRRQHFMNDRLAAGLADIKVGERAADVDADLEAPRSRCWSRHPQSPSRSVLARIDVDHHRHRRIAGGAALEQAAAAAADDQFLDQLDDRAQPVGPCGWPQTSEQP